MIIARLFTGDADMEVASKQHDVYGQALWIIVSKCHRYTEFARSLLNDADHSEWGTVERFDHRVLQHGHDDIVTLTHHKLRQPQDIGSKITPEYSIWWLGPSATG